MSSLSLSVIVYAPSSSKKPTSPVKEASIIERPFETRFSLCRFPLQCIAVAVGPGLVLGSPSTSEVHEPKLPPPGPSRCPVSRSTTQASVPGTRTPTDCGRPVSHSGLMQGWCGLSHAKPLDAQLPALLFPHVYECLAQRCVEP